MLTNARSFWMRVELFAKKNKNNIQLVKWKSIYYNKREWWLLGWRESAIAHSLRDVDEREAIKIQFCVCFIYSLPWPDATTSALDPHYCHFHPQRIFCLLIKLNQEQMITSEQTLKLTRALSLNKIIAPLVHLKKFAHSLTSIYQNVYQTSLAACK